MRLSPLTGTESSFLFDAIRYRQSTRNADSKQLVDANGLQKLESVAMEPGISLHLMTDGTQLEQLVEFVRAGDAGQFGDKAFVAELVRWIRFDEGEALQHHDGLFTGTTGNPSLPRWLGAFIVSNFSAGSQAQTDETNMRSSAGMSLLVSERNDKQA